MAQSLVDTYKVILKVVFILVFELFCRLFEPVELN